MYYYKKDWKERMSKDKGNQPNKVITLRQNAWYGDDQVELVFPTSWQVDLINGDDLPPLSSAQLRNALQKPVFTLPLRELARKSRKPIILVDDLTRPTTVDAILSIILEDLHSAGIPDSDITILIACGTHNGITTDEITRKLGQKIPGDIRVLVHNCHDCVQIGYTGTHTPIQVNRHVVESDLKIGIGGIYPHPVAGFSGGGKLLALGAGGYDTIRILHDQKEGTQFRDGNTDHSFRYEINEITKAIGYDFSVNLIINSDRQIAGVFCGDPEKAFQAGVEFYKQHFSVGMAINADIVVSDMYPFDTDFQYAFDRGLWPFEGLPKNVTKIVLVASLAGISDHALFPVTHPLESRIRRRLKYFSFPKLHQVKLLFRTMRKISKRRKMNVTVISRNLKESELQAALPNSARVGSWNEYLANSVSVIQYNSNLKVAIYQCAPLLIERTVTTHD